MEDCQLFVSVYKQFTTQSIDKDNPMSLLGFNNAPLPRMHGRFRKGPLFLCADGVCDRESCVSEDQEDGIFRSPASQTHFAGCLIDG